MNASPDELIALIHQRSKRIRPLPVGQEEAGSLPRKPTTVLFDIYGTLLVRLPEAGSRSRGERRHADDLIGGSRLPATHEELEDLVSGAIARQNAARRAQGVAYPEVVIERVWGQLFPGLTPAERRRAIVEQELAVHPAWLMPGCRKLLRSLSRRGIALGIVSNAQFFSPLFLRALAGKDLEDLGFSSSLCVYSFELGVAKPDQALFIDAAERLRRLGLRARDALMVGNDYGNDVSPAARAGLMTVYAALDRRSAVPTARDGNRPRPDAVIRRLQTLEGLVEDAR